MSMLLPFRRRPRPYRQIEPLAPEAIAAAQARPAATLVRQERVTGWLEGRARAYELDADHQDAKVDAQGQPHLDKHRHLTPTQRRAIADELRDCARDFGATA